MGRKTIKIKPETANRLKQIRKEKGLSQKALANEIGASKTSLCRWEKGTQNISSYYLQQYADYFNCSVLYLECKTDKRKGNEIDIDIERSKIILQTIKTLDKNFITLVREYSDFEITTTNGEYYIKHKSSGGEVAVSYNDFSMLRNMFLDNIQTPINNYFNSHYGDKLSFD